MGTWVDGEMGLYFPADSLGFFVLNPRLCLELSAWRQSPQAIGSGDGDRASAGGSTGRAWELVSTTISHDPRLIPAADRDRRLHEPPRGCSRRSLATAPDSAAPPPGWA